MHFFANDTQPYPSFAMKTWIRTLALVFSAAASQILTAQIDIPEQTMLSIFRDPEFQKSFVGSYGFMAGREPQVAPEEIKFFKELLESELLTIDPSTAAIQIESEVQARGSKASGALVFILANLHLQQQNYDSAIRYYDEALKRHPHFLRAAKNLGLAYLQKNDFKKGAEALGKAVALGDGEGATFGLLGYSYMNLGQSLQAEAAYRQAIILDPNTSDWKEGLARSLFDQQLFKEANALFMGNVIDNPSDAKNWLFLVNGYLGLNQPMEAATVLEIIRRLDAATPANLSLLGDIYLNSQNFDLALEVYSEAMEKGEGIKAQVLLRTAGIFASYGSFEEAATLVSRVDSRMGNSLSREEKMELLTLKARIARAQGNMSEAQTTLEEIINQDPTQGKALLELAKIYSQSGDKERASMKYQAAIKLEKFQIQAFKEYGQFLVRQGDYDEALINLRQSIALEYDKNLDDFIQRVERAATARRRSSL